MRDNKMLEMISDSAESCCCELIAKILSSANHETDTPESLSLKIMMLIVGHRNTNQNLLSDIIGKIDASEAFGFAAKCQSNHGCSPHIAGRGSNVWKSLPTLNSCVAAIRRSEERDILNSCAKPSAAVIKRSNSL